LHRAIVQSRLQALQHLDLADRAVAPHDDLEHDIARDAALPRVFGVIGTHFAQKTRRLDAAARTIRAAAGAATGSRSDAAAVPGSESRARSRAGAAAFSRTVAVGLGSRLLEHADAVAVVGGRGHDRRDDHRQLLRLERRLGFGL